MRPTGTIGTHFIVYVTDTSASERFVLRTNLSLANSDFDFLFTTDKLESAFESLKEWEDVMVTFNFGGYKIKICQIFSHCGRMAI